MLTVIFYICIWYLIGIMAVLGISYFDRNNCEKTTIGDLLTYSLLGPILIIGAIFVFFDEFYKEHSLIPKNIKEFLDKELF